MCDTGTSRANDGSRSGEYKDAVFLRNLIGSHLDVESLFDLRHRAADNQHEAIRGLIGHNKAIGFGEIGHFLIFRFRATEPFRELSYAEPMAVVGAGWVGEPIYQTGQFFLVAHRQVDDEVQGLIGWKKTDRRCAPAGNCGANVLVQYLECLLGPSWDSDQQEHSGADNRSES